MEFWSTWQSTLKVDAATNTLVFSKKHKSNMKFLNHVASQGMEEIPNFIWDTFGSVAVDSRLFAPEELSAALRFSKLSIGRERPVTRLYINSNTLSVQQRLDLYEIVPRVKDFSISGCVLDAKFFEDLLSSFETAINSLSIECINICNCYLTEAQLLCLWKCSKYVRKLFVQSESVTESSLKVLSETLHQINQDYGCCKLDTLGMIRCGMNDLCLKEVAKIVPYIQSLHLDLSDKSGIINAGLGSLSDSIVKERSMPSFSANAPLDSLHITFTAREIAYRRLEACIPILKELSIQFGRLSTDSSKQYTYLHDIAFAINACHGDVRLRTLRVKKEHVEKCKEVMSTLLDADGNRIDLTVEPWLYF